MTSTGKRTCRTSERARQISVFHANPIRSYNFDETVKRSISRRRDPRLDNRDSEPLATVHSENGFHGTFGHAGATWVTGQVPYVVEPFNNGYSFTFVDDSPAAAVTNDAPNLHSIYRLKTKVPQAHAGTATEMTARDSKLSESSIRNTPTLMPPNDWFYGDNDSYLDRTSPAPVLEIDKQVVSPLLDNSSFAIDSEFTSFSANVEPEASTLQCDWITDEVLMALTEPFLMSWCFDLQQPLPSSFDHANHWDTTTTQASPISGQDSYYFRSVMQSEIGTWTTGFDV